MDYFNKSKHVKTCFKLGKTIYVETFNDTSTNKGKRFTKHSGSQNFLKFFVDYIIIKSKLIFVSPIKQYLINSYKHYNHCFTSFSSRCSSSLEAILEQSYICFRVLGSIGELGDTKLCPVH